MSQPAASPFLADALEANRAGVLTDEQRRILIAYVRNRRGNNLAGAALVVVLGIVILTSRSFAWSEALRPVAALAAFAVAVALVLSHLGVFSRVLKDARAGRVESIEGALSKERWVNQKSAQTGQAYLQVAGRTFVTGYGTYHELPDAGFVRLYYLPRSRRVVNMEALDRPLPQEVLDSPATLSGLVRASYSLDGVKAAEARATLAGIESAMAQAFPPSGPPAPPQQSDPRPLAQAILGSWRGGAFSLAFARDGTATVAPPLGKELHGRWSVDEAGRLHIDALGGAQAVDARVAGDSLTVVFEGSAYTFQRG